MSLDDHHLTEEQLKNIKKLREAGELAREAYQNYAMQILAELHKPDGDGDGEPKECDKYEVYDPSTKTCLTPKLPIDGREQFHKGASKDPNDWKVVTMSDDPSKYKITDNDNVNVADQFASQQNAETFITYYLWLQLKQNKCAEEGKQFDPGKNECVDEGQPPPGGDTDPNGVKMIYKTRGSFLTDWDKDSGRDAWDLSQPPINLEATGYFKGPGGDDVSVKLRGGRHTDENDMWGCCYILQIPTGGGNPSMQTECPHPSGYEDCSITSQNRAMGINQWRGVKAIAYNRGNTVHLELWEDRGNSDNRPANEWVKLFEVDDSNGFCCDDCGPFPLLDHSNAGSDPRVTFRIDSGADEKWMSVVEIQPPGDQPPPPPPGVEFPYQAIGSPMQSSQRGPTTRHYRSRKDDDYTIEKNVKNIKFKNYQFVADITNDCEWAHDDTFSMKLGGRHTNEGWFDHGLGIFSGECCMGKEEDHPSTDLCVIRGPKLGDTRGKRFKLATTYFTETNYTELWTDFGDGWVKQMEASDVGGFNPDSPEDECQLRIDGFDKKNDPPTIHSAVVTEIAAAPQRITAGKVSAKGEGIRIECSDDLD